MESQKTNTQRYDNQSEVRKELFQRSLYFNPVSKDSVRQVNYYLEEHQKDMLEIIVNEYETELHNCKVLVVETINENPSLPCTLSSSKPMGVHAIPDLYLNTGVMLTEYDELNFDFVVANLSGIKDGYTLETVIKTILDSHELYLKEH